MRQKKIPSTKPFFSAAQQKFIARGLRDVFSSGRLILGKYAKDFEERFAAYIGTRYAAAVSSCTSALEIALRYHDVRGARVLMPTNTFVATANAVVFAGGKPVLVDIEKETLALDLEKLHRRIDARTKGVIVVHIAGIPYPYIRELKTLCARKGLFLIEDTAHACGAVSGGKKAGSWSGAGCFSLYPTKVMTTGTGGMITTDDKKLYEFARSLRHHGVGGGLTNITRLGNDWVLDELRAVCGIAQLKELERMIHLRREKAARYDRALRDLAGVRIFNEPRGERWVYYKYPIVVPTPRLRQRLMRTLYEKYAIETGSIYYPPCHLQPLYKNKFGYRKGDFPVAEKILARVLCLPLYPALDVRTQDFVIKALRKELKTS